MHDQDEATQLQPQDLLRSLMDITISELKLGHDPWQKLPQHKQDQIIDRVANRSRDLVREMLSIISSEGFKRVPVTVDQIVIKDGIKAQISLGKGEAGRHHLYDAQGQLCTLVLVDAEQFTDAPHGFKADLQQLTLPLSELTDAQQDAGEPDAPPPVTQDQLEALEQRIVEMRKAHEVTGAVEDSPEIAELVTQRDLLVLQLAQQSEPQTLPTQDELNGIDERLTELRTGGAPDDAPEVVDLLEKRRAMVEAITSARDGVS